MDTTKEFIAYCRKLLRVLTKIEDALKKNNIKMYPIRWTFKTKGIGCLA